MYFTIFFLFPCIPGEIFTTNDERNNKKKKKYWTNCSSLRADACKSFASHKSSHCLSYTENRSIRLQTSAGQNSPKRLTDDLIRGQTYWEEKQLVSTSLVQQCLLLRPSLGESEGSWD
jgi:hypothetical protein